MDITYTLGEPLEDRTRRPQTITITLTPEDDPAGHIVGLLIRERLEAFLRCYPRPTEEYAGCADEHEARDLLLKFAFVAKMCASRLEAMQLEARDRWGMSWGTIAGPSRNPGPRSRARSLTPAPAGSRKVPGMTPPAFTAAPLPKRTQPPRTRSPQTARTEP